MLETLIGVAGLSAGLSALVREAIHYRRTRTAQDAKLKALQLVDANELRDELWKAFRDELTHLREKDERQQKTIDRLQSELRTTQEDLIESQNKRHNLRSQVNAMGLKVELLNTENGELRARVRELEIHVRGIQDDQQSGHGCKNFESKEKGVSDEKTH